MAFVHSFSLARPLLRPQTISNDGLWRLLVKLGCIPEIVNSHSGLAKPHSEIELKGAYSRHTLTVWLPLLLLGSQCSAEGESKPLGPAEQRGCIDVFERVRMIASDLKSKSWLKLEILHSGTMERRCSKALMRSWCWSNERDVS